MPAADLTLPPDLTLPTCTDQVKNGTETDTDCGGASCPTCADGKRCGGATDCASGVCRNGVCTPRIGLVMSGGVRRWADGTVARSCNGYRSPSGDYVYTGDTGSGTYTIDPDGSGPSAPFDVYCDMTTNGGGWTRINDALGGYVGYSKLLLYVFSAGYLFTQYASIDIEQGRMVITEGSQPTSDPLRNTGNLDAICAGNADYFGKAALCTGDKQSTNVLLLRESYTATAGKQLRTTLDRNGTTGMSTLPATYTNITGCSGPGANGYRAWTGVSSVHCVISASNTVSLPQTFNVWVAYLKDF